MIRLIFLLATLVGGVWLGTTLQHELAVDRCLDHGGRWNVQGGYCE